MQLRSASALFGATALLTLLHIFGSSAAILLFIFALPARVRAGSLSLVYALAIAIFGGSTQLVEKLLIRWTANPIAPGWYMVCAVVAGLSGALLIREPAELRRLRGVGKRRRVNLPPRACLDLPDVGRLLEPGEWPWTPPRNRP